MHRRIFAEGIVVNLLNPKMALFLFAFLSQFVDPEGNVRMQIVLLGLTLNVMGMLTDSVYAVAAGSIADRLRTDERFPRVRRVGVATTYIALSALALLVHPTKLWTKGLQIGQYVARNKHPVRRSPWSLLGLSGQTGWRRCTDTRSWQRIEGSGGLRWDDGMTRVVEQDGD